MQRSDQARRQFLKYLAASPYVAALGGVDGFLQNAMAQDAQADLIQSPGQALSR